MNLFLKKLAKVMTPGKQAMLKSVFNNKDCMRERLYDRKTRIEDCMIERLYDRNGALKLKILLSGSSIKSL